MEIEMKDYNEGTEKSVSEVAVETQVDDILSKLLKVDLKQDAKAGFNEACRILKLILSNILKDPEDMKFRTIKEKNPKFHSAFGKFRSSASILEVIGFERVEADEPIWIYAQDSLETLKRYAAYRVINSIDKALSRSEFHADVHENRMKENRSKAMILAENKGKEVMDQLQMYRNRHKATQPRKNKIMTLADLDKKEEYSEQPPKQVYNSISSFVDPRNLKMRAFELSNLFRVSEGKRELVWNEGLSEIALQHSINMGEGVVPFGHEGFNKRFKSFPFRSTRGGAENVAYNYGCSDPAKTTVDGWIKSPGHRKNLLGNFIYMGIGVYVNRNGYYYFTQLFALV